MFNFGLFEILCIAVIAVLVIGPKELPMVMAQCGRLFKRLNYMRYALQGQFDDFLRQNGMDDLHHQVNFETEINSDQGDDVANVHKQAMEKARAQNAASDMDENKDVIEIAYKSKDMPENSSKKVVKKAVAARENSKKTAIKKVSAKKTVSKKAATKKASVKEGGVSSKKSSKKGPTS